MNIRGFFAVGLFGALLPPQLCAAAEGGRDDGVSRIIVTGEKKPRSLQDTATSVAVTTARSILDQNLLSMYDLLDRTANLAVDANRTSFSIRGIDASDVSGGGYGSLASVYVDGAVLPQKALSAGPLDLFDVSQIEVFRGPQSTIQGRNALAGAIIIRTNDPSYRWSGQARLLMTDKDGQRRAAAAVGGPLIDGQIAFRVAAERARSDGLIRNVTANMEGDQRLAETLRTKLLVTPHAVPALQLLATYSRGRYRRGTLFSDFSPPYKPQDRVSTEDVRSSQQVKSDIGSLEIGYAVHPGLQLSSITNYSRTGSLNISDPDRSPAPGQSSRLMDPTKTFQQELRLNIDLPWVQGVMGGYYLKEDNQGYTFDSFQDLSLRSLGVDRQLRGLGLSQAMVDAVLSLYGGVVPIRNVLAQPLLTSNHAGFADFTMPLTGDLQILAGIRFDREQQMRGAMQTVEISRALPDPSAVPFAQLRPIIAQLNSFLQATAAGASNVEPARRVTYQAWLPKVGISYHVGHNVAVSATARRGYRAGGTGLNQQRAQAYEFKPEFVWNYELALRSHWFDRQLTVNANLYRLDWKDQQISVQLTPGAVFDRQVVNAGRSRLFGFELDLHARPARSLTLAAGIGYARTRFRHFDVATDAIIQGSAAGNEFARAPRWTLSGAATYRHSSGLLANINANGRSASFQDAVEQSRRDIPGRRSVNGKWGWQGQNFGTYLVATNIFNVQKPTQRFTDLDGRVRGTLSAPRILGVLLEGQF